MSGLLDKTTQSLAASAGFRQMRGSVISSNIANAETPGYSAKKMDFEDALSRALDLEGYNKIGTSDPQHFATGPNTIGRVRADVYENPDVEKSNDGNTVDLEKEMAALVENGVMYKAVIQLINKKLASLKYAASDGGR